MKRSEQLKKLSWEHHDALKFARRIRKGMNNGTTPERIARYVIFIVETLLQPHFKLEEESLIKRLSSAQAQDIVVTQVVADHREFNRLVGAMKGRGRRSWAAPGVLYRSAEKSCKVGRAAILPLL